MAFAGLGVLAAISVGLSALPWPAKLPLCALALGHGLVLARREWRRPACVLEIGADGVAMIRSGASLTPLAAPRLALRGALAALSWRDPEGRKRSLLWCADTLPASSRRLLRLRLGADEAGARA